MTYRQICATLEHAGVEAAEWDAALLIEHFCNVRADAVRLDSNREYASDSLTEAVRRRAEHFPLQYLLGEWQFYRQTYEVSPDCLIPRADTEILVEEAIKLLPHGARFADLCTGSGCIAVSVLAERPDTRACAVEKFTPTLALAERNAERNGVGERLEPICADVLLGDALPKDGRFDAIVSNPPYISANALKTLAPELDFEPRAALDGGEDGLVFYRAMLSPYADRLTPDGFFLFEIGYDQAEAVTALGRMAGFSVCRLIKDFGGNDRVVYLARGEAAR